MPAPTALFHFLATIASLAILRCSLAAEECDVAQLSANAQAGNARARFHLGQQYYSGGGVNQSYSRAALLWQLAAADGVIEAENNLGYLYYYGFGVERDMSLAVTLWRDSARNGFSESQLFLSYAYSDGLHLARDNSQAYAWARVALRNAIKTDHSVIISDARRQLRALRAQLRGQQVQAAETLARSYIETFPPQPTLLKGSLWCTPQVIESTSPCFRNKLCKSS